MVSISVLFNNEVPSVVKIGAARPENRGVISSSLVAMQDVDK